MILRICGENSIYCIRQLIQRLMQSIVLNEA